MHDWSPDSDSCHRLSAARQRATLCPYFSILYKGQSDLVTQGLSSFEGKCLQANTCVYTLSGVYVCLSACMYLRTVCVCCDWFAQNLRGWWRRKTLVSLIYHILCVCGIENVIKNCQVRKAGIKCLLRLVVLQYYSLILQFLI